MERKPGELRGKVCRAVSATLEMLNVEENGMLVVTSVSSKGMNS